MNLMGSQPVISAEIMQIHYTKHHQGYVNNLNKALADYATAESKQDISQMDRFFQLLNLMVADTLTTPSSGLI